VSCLFLLRWLWLVHERSHYFVAEQEKNRTGTIVLDIDLVLFAALSIHSILLVCSKKDGANFLLFSKSRISELRISSHFDGECVPADFEQWERRSHRNIGFCPTPVGFCVLVGFCPMGFCPDTQSRMSGYRCDRLPPLRTTSAVRSQSMTLFLLWKRGAAEHGSRQWRSYGTIRDTASERQPAPQRGAPRQPQGLGFWNNISSQFFIYSITQKINNSKSRLFSPVILFV